ncbi:Fe2+ or Zn2+ uptake regulation protein [Streptacidiphilus sp. MAP12-16]|uniref:transcriptional repressor n=1 Tax=Streptacidiphilus sp. MAP12-16 TaxID=3156300 RepID=UPI0035132C3C
MTATRVALLETVRDGDHLGVRGAVVRSIEPTGSPARFERRVRDHHVVCRSCGVVADVDRVVGEGPCLTAFDDHSFPIDEAEVISWGLCPDCSTARSS